MMRLLLDTQILYWTLYDQSRQPALAVQLMLNAEAIYVSAASIWEIALKTKSGRMIADLDEVIATLGPAGFTELPVTPIHAARVATLPLHHGDPFDRILIAQAMREPLHFITADRQLPPYSSLVILV